MSAVQARSDGQSVVLDVNRLNEAVIAEAAAQLFEAAQTGVPCIPVRSLIGEHDVDAAYAVQDFNTHRALAAGRRLVGRKIGLTSRAVQQQLGVNQPDFGMLFADMAVGEDTPIPAGMVLQPKIEAELALILAADLDDKQPIMADLLNSIAYVVPALEIVGSRINNWDIRIADTIADNASSGLYVLGGPARRIDGLDLRNASMTMRRGADTVSTGSGVACLGHPLNAAVWLAREVALRGRPLRRGDVVLTGALGPMVTVQPGDRFEAEISGFGMVSAVFSAD